MATWPGTLPQNVMMDGYSETPPQLIIRTEMDAGPAKVRRRFTSNIRPIKGKIRITKAQVVTLDTFIVTTLEGGALSFDWVNQRTGSSVSFRFVSMPQYVPIAGDLLEVNLDLEQLP